MSERPLAVRKSPHHELASTLRRLHGFGADLEPWLDADPRHVELAVSFLQLQGRPKLVKMLGIVPNDLIRSDHHSAECLSRLARDRKAETEELDAHIEDCSLCDGIVEAQAVHLILVAAFRTNPPGFRAKTPEAATDNDKWFAGGPGPRERG